MPYQILFFFLPMSGVGCFSTCTCRARVARKAINARKESVPDDSRSTNSNDTTISTTGVFAKENEAENSRGAH